MKQPRTITRRARRQRRGERFPFSHHGNTVSSNCRLPIHRQIPASLLNRAEARRISEPRRHEDTKTHKGISLTSRPFVPSCPSWLCCFGCGHAAPSIDRSDRSPAQRHREPAESESTEPLIGFRPCNHTTPKTSPAPGVSPLCFPLCFSRKRRDREPDRGMLAASLKCAKWQLITSC